MKIYGAGKPRYPSQKHLEGRYFIIEGASSSPIVCCGLEELLSEIATLLRWEDLNYNKDFDYKKRAKITLEWVDRDV